MTLSERIKKLRKVLDLTQREFGKRISMKQNSVAQIEMGRNTSEQTIFSICREFNVSETWLRTGEGEMFVPKEEDALDELVKQYELSDGDHVLIEKFLKLKPTERQTVISYMQEVVAALNAGKDIPTPVAPTPSVPDIVAELAEMKRQNKELQARLEFLEKEEEEKERRHTKQSVSPARSHTQ